MPTKLHYRLSQRIPNKFSHYKELNGDFQFFLSYSHNKSNLAEFIAEMSLLASYQYLMRGEA